MSKSSTNISHRPHGHKNYWKPLIVAAACVAVLLFVLANSTINHHESRSHDQEDSSERFAILAASRRQQKALPVIKVKHMESTVSMLPFTELPGFAIGNREYVFTSLIERSMANILDFHVTTFLLGHTFIQAPELPSRNVRKHRQGDWSRAAQHASKTEYYPSGRRKYVPKDRFTCRIRHSSKSQPYIVAGDFVPNRATSTVSSNRRIDILRCPFVLHDIVELQRLLMDDDSMQVEIYQGSVALIAFEIPWRRRVVGYLSNSPREAFSLDLWDGVVCSDPSCHVATMNNASFLPLSTNGVLDGKPKPLTVHLCAPCMKKAISRDNLPMVLEYIAHHLNIGFEHITIASVWHPASVHFQRLVNLLAPFIRDRQLSILSLADPRDETSPLFEIEGMAFFRYVMATIQANLCLYLSKGVADYLLVQDLDELLVPKSIDVDRDTIGHLIASNIADNLVANADSTVGWIGGPGWADGHRHPLCYLAIQSELILRSASAVISATTLHRPRPWLGEEFGHGAEINSTRPYVASRQTIQNSIVPVQDIFYVGTRSPGACALPWQWNGCNNADVEICLDPFGDVEPAGIEPETIARQRIHTFDERVLQRDARLIPKSDAVVYHFRFYDSVIVASESTMNSTNAYSSHWFPRARKLLESKGFGFFFDLPVGVSSGVMPGKSADLMPLLSASNSDVNSLTSGNDVPMVSEGVEVASVEDGALLNDPFAEVLAPLQPFPPFALTTLPHFSNDLSELALTSMIERTASSYHLFATTFFLCHYTARNQANINQQVFLRVHPKAQEKWSYIQSLYSRTRFTLPGKRAKVDEFTCRLRTVERIDGSRGGDTSSVNSTVYQPVEDYVMVRGVFVPSATTIDFNANYRVETLRCSLGAERSRKAYHDYAGKSQYLLEVEIYKNSARLMGFVVPWEARVTGYMSFSPRPIAEWQEGLMDAVGASGDVKDWLEADDAATSGGSQSETETVVSDAVAGGEGEAEEVDWAVSSSSNTGLANIPGASPPSATVPTSDASSSLKTSTLTAEGSLVGRIRARALYALPSTSLSPWDGVDLAMPPQQWSMQRLFLCVPGVRTAPSRHFLPHLLEFLEHHYRMGVSHILLAVCFSWRSIHMRRLLRAVRPYIEEKKLSIQTHTVHPLDFRFVVGGAVARNTPIKVFATHLCLYYAKGLADYLAVWDVDEFFVPHGSNQNLIDLLDHADNISTIHDPLSIPPATAVIPPSQSFISQPAAINWTVWNDEYRNHPHPHGWADGHAHPLCYLQLYSTALYQVPGRTAESSSEYIWFADNFQPRAKAIDHLAHKKAIHPTRRSFSLNLHTGGACALPQQWTDCAVSTSSPANLMVDLTRNASLSMTLSAAGVLDPLLAAESSGDDQAVHCLASRKSIRTEFAARHNFDEPPHLGDAHNFDRDTEGELYHVQFFRRKHLATNKSAPDEVSDNNLYAKHFGAGVRHALDMRGLFWPLHLLNDPGFRGPSSLLSTPRDAHAPSTHSATVDGMVVLSAFLDGLATTQGAELRVLLALDPDQAGLSAPKRVRQLGTTGQVATTLPAGWMLSSTGNASHAAELKWKTPCPRAVRAVTCTVLIGSSSSSLPVEIPAKVETIMAGVISIQCPISQDLSEKLCLNGGQSMLTSLLISSQSPYHQR